MDDDVRKKLDETIQTLREGVNAMLDQFGEATLAEHGDADVALARYVAYLQGTTLSRDGMAAALAFAVRRLWSKRSSYVRPNWN